MGGIILLTILLILVIVCGLWVLAIRTNQRTSDLKKMIIDYHYAHRGLHKADSGIPENSLLAFKLSAHAGYGAELDVHLSADNRLVVMHDDNLKRMCGIDADICDMEAKDLDRCRLSGTNEKIPYLEEVLAIYSGKAPLIVELKTCDRFDELAKLTCEMLDSFPQVRFCIESFDPRILRWLKKNRPEIIRGQLSFNFFKGSGKYSFIRKFLATFLLMNFLSVPDFVAYRLEDRKNPSMLLCRWIWNTLEVNWTVRSNDDVAEAMRDDRIVIFEGFLPK